MISVDRFAKSAQDAAERAAEIMQRYSHNQVDTEHLLLALVEQPQGVVSQLLEFLEVNPNALTAGLDEILRNGPKGETVQVGPGQVSITPRIVRIIDLAIEETNRLKDELISDEHLFLAMFSERDTSAAQLLAEAGLTHDGVYDAVQKMRG